MASYQTRVSRSSFSGVGIQNVGSGDFRVEGNVYIGDLGVAPSLKAYTTSPTVLVDKQCLADLRVTDSRDDKRRIERTKGGLLKGAYGWVLDHPDFRQWRDDEQSRLLWIKGDPGKGKTMLLCGIIDHLRPVTKLADPKAGRLMSYFFCQATDLRINSATAVLRGLIYLLVVQQPSLLSKIRDDYERAGAELFKDANAWFALSRIFTDILQDEALKDACIIIDGLDECSKDLPELLDFIDQNSRPSHVKWIVSSRNWRQIEEHLSGSGQNVLLSLELNNTSISAAVDAYIRHKVEHLTRAKGYDDSTRHYVRNHLQSNSNNTFLWVALVCQDLERPRVTRRSTITRLKSFPPGLDAIYLRMMEQINDSDDAELCRRVLAVVSVVERPITLPELTSLDLSLHELSEDLESVADIIANCYSFLTIQDGFIYHIHQSVKEFFVQQPLKQIFPNGIMEEHSSIFGRSMEVMFHSLHRDMYHLRDMGCPIEQIQAPIPDPLAHAHYSCMYWVDHLCRAGELRDENATQLARFLREKFLCWLEYLSLLGNVPRGSTSLLELRSFIQKGPSTALKELVYDAYRFIVQNSWMTAKAPLQTYGSALRFTPSKCLIRQFFKEEEPSWVSISCIGEDWDACLLDLQSINWLWYLPGGKNIVTVAEDRRTISIRDADTGACLHTQLLDLPTGYHVTLSPTGTHLASIVDCSFLIWELSTGSCLQGPDLRNTDDECRIMCSVFSPDGSHLILASRDATVTTWDTSTGVCLRSFSCIPEYDYYMNSGLVCLSGDGSRMASAIYRGGGSWVLWDTTTGARLQGVASYDAEYRAIYLSPNGHILVTTDQMRSFAVWDTNNEALLWTAHDGFDFGFSNDSSILLTASKTDIRLRNIHSGVCERLIEHNHRFNWYILSPDNRRLAVGTSDNNAKVWDVGSDIRLARNQSNAHCISLSADESRLATADDNTVKIWDSSSVDCLHVFEGHESEVECVAFAPDGLQVASKSKDGIVKIWDSKEGTCLHTLKHTHEERGSVAFSLGGDYLATSCASFIKIWNTKSGEFVQKLDGFCGFDYPKTFSPKSDLLVSTSVERRTSSEALRIWDAHTGSWLQTLEGHTDRVNCAAFAPNQRSLVSGSEDCIIKVWDIDSGMCLQTFCYKYPIWSVAISPDNCLVASASGDHTIQIWERDSGAVRTLQDDSTVRSLVFSPDSNLLASGAHHHSLKLWSVRSGVCLKTLHGKSLNEEKQNYPVTSYISRGTVINNPVDYVEFSSDGSSLTSTSHNGTICVWNIHSGEIQAIFGVGSHVTSTACSANGRYLASNSLESVKIWDTRDKSSFITVENDPGGPFHRVYGRVSFSPDSTRLKLSSVNSITTWDIKSGECLGSVSGHHSCDQPLSFSESSGCIIADSSINHGEIWSGERRGNIQGIGHQHVTHEAACNPQNTTILSSSTAVSSLLRSLGIEDPINNPKDMYSSDLGLSENLDWVTWKGQNILMLPPDYKPRCLAIGRRTIAIVSIMGIVITLRFSDMELFQLENEMAGLDV